MTHVCAYCRGWFCKYSSSWLHLCFLKQGRYHAMWACDQPHFRAVFKSLWKSWPSCNILIQSDFGSEIVVCEVTGYVCMYVCMDWAVDGTDLTHEPILESAQEYQDKDFSDEVCVWDTPHPLLPWVLIQCCYKPRKRMQTRLGDQGQHQDSPAP